MRQALSLFVLGVMVLSLGCIRSLYPLYSEKDIVYDQKLVGEWSEEDSSEIWKFSQGGDNWYRLVYTDDKGEQGAFSAHLLKIKGEMFIDFYPVEPEMTENAFYQAHLLPVHTFAHVRRIEPRLQMAFPDHDWLKKLLETNPAAIEHAMIDGEVVLTASTEKLQAFWLAHLRTTGVFDNRSDMSRIER